MKGRLSRWLRRILLVGLLLVVALSVLAYLASQVFFTPDRLVRQLERKRNCRAAISEVAVSLFSHPAKVVLTDVAIGERDDYARQHVRLKDRPKVQDPAIQGKSIALTASLPHLLLGKLRVRDVVATDVVVTMIKPEKGDNSLEKLFDKPDKAPKASKGTTKAQEDDDDDKTVDDLPFATTLASARCENLEFVLQLEEKETQIRFHDVDLTLTDLIMDAGDLENRNQGALTANGKVAFDHLTSDLHFGDLILEGTGTVRPYDRKTRKLEPAIGFEMNVLKGSRIETMPLIDAIVAKIGDLEDYGIDLDRVDINGDLQENAVVRGAYREERLILADPLELTFEDYDLVVGKGSWYDGKDSEHLFDTKILLTQAATDRSLSGMESFVKRHVKVIPTKNFRRLLDKYLVTNGRLGVQLLTKGDFGRPKVRFNQKLPDLEDLLKDAAEELLGDSLLDGLRSLLK